jgi:spore coat polysaccharide biosynthesis protein SpsF
MLQYLLERLAHCNLLDRVVVATSTDASDDPIKLCCDSIMVECFRGSLHDVAGRFDAVIQEYQFDAFVRVNGDSPLLDQNLIDRGVSLFVSGEFDLVTNILPRTFPAGQSVEVLRSETYRQTYRLMHTADDLEHVTKFFYRNSEDFKILNFACDFDCHDWSFAIDTADNLDVFTNMVIRMTKPHWEYSLSEILGLYRNNIDQAGKFNS